MSGTLDTYGPGGTNKKYENDEVVIITADTEVTFNITTSGVDTQTNRYMNLPNGANKWSFTPSAAVQITKINGTTLKVPKTIGANKTWESLKGMHIYSFVVKVPTANTDLKLSCMG